VQRWQCKGITEALGEVVIVVRDVVEAVGDAVEVVKDTIVVVGGRY
jgi:hypothetical protein